MTKNSSTDESINNQPRGDFNLLGVKRDKKPKTKVMLVIGGGILFLFLTIGSVFFFAFKAMSENNPSKVDESKVKADAALEAKPITDDDIKKKRELIIKKRQQEEKERQEQTKPVPQQPNKGGQGSVEPEAVQQSAAYQRKLSGGVTVQETGGASTSQSASEDDPDEQRIRSNAQAIQDTDYNPGLSMPNDSGRGSLSNLNSTSYAPSKAYLSPERKFLLKRKSNVRCALYTAVKTDHPGFVKCILTQPLYSSDGSVILAEAGAELDGEQKVEIRPGQTSVFTSWTDLETTAGVRANLNALGTGAMGESGTNAYIDNHYGKRFGGAVMLSFIQDAFQSAANATKSNNSTYSFDNSQSNAESMASKALENSINIPPTGYVLPGTVINVIVAQDVDFSSTFKTRR